MFNPFSSIAFAFIHKFLNYFMDIKEYQLLTRKTAIYPQETFLEYLTLGLASEAGEVSGVVKKYIRKDNDLDTAKEKLIKELGDVMWYWARLCDELGLNPEEVMEKNINKLLNRQANNTLQGDGDDR
jgi:NTP pyrophosphatase (non-canonical NTP hydrolase)